MLLAALLALSPAHADPQALPDVGVTLDIPAGWEMTRWSNWDWKGKTADGSVAVDVWATPFQVPVTKEAAVAWAGLYTERLDDMRAVGILRDSVAIEEIAARPTARTTMHFAFDQGGPKGVMLVAAFAVEGQMIHVSTLAAGPNAGRAKAALDALLTRLTVDKPAADLSTLGGPATTTLGFTPTLPDGWRRPLPVEDAYVSDAAAAILIGPKDPAACLHAVRPRPSGEADVLLFCGETWKLGIVDEDSFADAEKALKARFFGKAADKIPDGTQLARAERLGILLAPEINGKDLRIGALPYDRGTVVVWGIGEPGTGAELESAVRGTAASLSFDGPDGGASVHDMGEWLVHMLTYEPFHPAIVGSGVLFCGILAGFGWLVFRKPGQTDAVV